MFLSVPILDIDTSIFVPGTRYFGGSKPDPTPKHRVHYELAQPYDSEEIADERFGVFGELISIDGFSTLVQWLPFTIEMEHYVKGLEHCFPTYHQEFQS